MANYNPFSQPPKIFLPLVAAASGFFVLCLMWGKLPNRLLATFSPPGLAQAKAAKISVQKDQAFRNVVAKLEQDAKEKRLTFAAPPQFQSRVFEEVQLQNKEKVIALTFDDGPWPENTPKILDILKQNQIKATFFVVGQAVKAFPELMQAIVKDGHAIGNHTWSHSYRNFSAEGAKDEIERTAEIIYETTGVKTWLFRPPGGFMHNGVVDYAKKRDYAIVMWSSDSNDYKRPPVPTFLNSVLSYTAPGGIILMHDGGGDRSPTVAALPKLIAELRKQGYKFVTVAELLKMQSKQSQLTAVHKSLAGERSLNN